MDANMEPDFLDRYQRQLSLREVGIPGQRALRAARVMIVGLGGLGCPALQYLAAAGVGKLVLVDEDVVSLSNLHRQTLYTPEDVGQKKVDVAARWVLSMNSSLDVVAIPDMFQKSDSQSFLNEVDLVVDSTDNFTARYAINDACAAAGIPWVYGSISKFEGQVSVFNVPLLDGIQVQSDSNEHSSVSTEETEQSAPQTQRFSLNYRDVFPNPPAAGEVQNCAESGVLGALAGIVGSMQAMEALKYILKTEGLLVNQLLTYDAMHHRLVKFSLNKLR